MKLVISAIVLVFLSSSVLAGDKKKKENKKGKAGIECPKGKPKHPHGKRFHGNRSLEEILKGVQKRLGENDKFAEFFKKRADSDADGKVSDEEIKKAISKIGERRKKGKGHPRGKGRPDPKGQPKPKGRPE